MLLFLVRITAFSKLKGLFLERHVAFSATSPWLYWCGCHPRKSANLEMRLPFCSVFLHAKIQKPLCGSGERSQKAILRRKNSILEAFHLHRQLVLSWILNGSCHAISHTTIALTILPRNNHYLISWSLSFFLSQSYVKIGSQSHEWNKNTQRKSSSDQHRASSSQAPLPAMKCMALGKLLKIPKTQLLLWSRFNNIYFI